MFAKVRRVSIESDGNLTTNARVIAVKSHNNIVRSTGPHKDIVLAGVDNLIIIQSEHGTLIADKSDEEAIRQAIAELQQKTG